jgi:hypothetical protein
VVQHLKELLDRGWRVPPARPAFAGQSGSRKATKEDTLYDPGFNLSVKVGDMIAPAGLYASAHDMFAFLIHAGAQIDDGTLEGCSRGFFIENSEVGAKSLRYTSFLYRHVCGNHIVWDVSKVKRTRVRHVGKARDTFEKIFKEIRAATNAAAGRDEERIRRAQRRVIDNDPDQAIQKVFQRLGGMISLVQLQEAFDLAAEYEADTVDPRSVWGFVQGITRLSQQTQFADQRASLDQGAGRILRLFV